MTDTSNPVISNKPPTSNDKHLLQDLLQHKKLLYVGGVLLILVFIGAMVLIRQGQNKINKASQESTTVGQSKTMPEASAIIATDKIPPDKPREIASKTQPETQQTITKTSSLYLKSDTDTYTNGATVNLQVIIQGKGEKVDGAEFILNYDSKLVSIGVLTTGTFFSLYPQKTVNAEKGTVRVIALQKPDENKSCNEEVIVNFPVTLLQKGQVSLSFAKDKAHIAGYGGKELLEETIPLTITVN